MGGTAESSTRILRTFVHVLLWPLFATGRVFSGIYINTINRKNRRREEITRVRDLLAIQFEKYSDNSVCDIAQHHASRLFSEQQRLKNGARINLALGITIVIFLLYFIGVSFYSISNRDATYQARLEEYRRLERAQMLIERCQDIRKDVRIARKSMSLDLDELNNAMRSICNSADEANKEPEKSTNSPRGFWDQVSVQDMYSMLSRFTLVLLSQLVAFFFLRLYVSNQQDIKYFANELSNLQYRYQAYLICRETPGATCLDSLVSELARSERNFILRRGEKVAFASDPPVLRDLSEAVGQLTETLRANRAAP